MKIIEALKELSLLEKRIQKNIELVQVYSSELCINGAITFGTVDSQKTEVSSLLQSVRDLVARRGRIRRALAITNATVTVTIDGDERTITEWIEFRQKGAQFIINSLGALNEVNAQRKLQVAGGKVDGNMQVRRFFDEKTRNKELAAVQEKHGKVDPTLEIVNATKDLTVEV
jgi:hypothetical protein